MNPIIAQLEKEHSKQKIDEFGVGDTVDVHVRIIEGEKERIQIFNGVVIGRNGKGMGENFTVRRLVQGEGVERVFPIHAPRVEKVVVKRHGRIRRAKLYFLRDRVGKATRLTEDKRVRKMLGNTDPEPEAAAPAPAEAPKA